MSEDIRRECSSVGSDESGNGSLFGGFSVAGFRLTKENLKKLKQFSWYEKITDSKNLTNEENLYISREITKNFTKEYDYYVFRISPRKYNKFVEGGKNPEEIKCIFHNLVHYKLAGDFTFHAIDNFLKTKNKGKEYYKVPTNCKIIPIDVFLNNGDKRVLSISLASILARGDYLDSIKKLKNELRINFSDKENHGTDDDYGHRFFSTKVFESIFNQLEKDGLSRKYVYENYCKIDKVKIYNEQITKFSID